MNSIKKRQLNTLLAFLSVYFIIQVIIITYFGYTPSGDADFNIKLAEDILNQGNFTFYPGSNNLYQDYVYANGWINLIILCYKVWHNIYIILLLNCIATTLSAYYFFRLTERLLDNKTAWWALGIYCAYLTNYAMNTYALTEVPFFFFLISGLYFATSMRTRELLFAGFLLIIANWIRPIIVIIIIPILIFYWIKKRLKTSVLPLMISMLLTVFLIGGVTYLKCDKFIIQASTGWYNLLQGMGKNSNGYTNLSMFIEPDDIGYIEGKDTLTIFQKNEIWKHRAIEWLKNHPVDYIKQAPSKFYYLFISDNYAMHAFRTDKCDNSVLFNYGIDTTLKAFPNLTLWRWMSLLNFIFYLIVMIGGTWGYILAFTHRKWNLALPFLIISCGTILTVAIICNSRYHHLYIPFIMIGLAYLITQKRGKTTT